MAALLAISLDGRRAGGEIRFSDTHFALAVNLLLIAAYARQTPTERTGP